MRSNGHIVESDISIIIPALNEADHIGKLLHTLNTTFLQCELIVVDGGSTDDTVKQALRFARVIETTSGRGHQMNVGAERASRKVLWFLHADCRPHSDSVRAIVETMNSGHYVGGGFEYGFGNGSRYLALCSKISNIKNRLKSQLFGDMGMFVRRDTFFDMGGFTQAYLMEDFDFGRRLKRRGRVSILPLTMETSPRDWHATGAVRKTVKDFLIRIAFLLRTDERTLYRWYYGRSHEANH